MHRLFSRFGSVGGINAKSTVMSPILWLFGICFTGTGLLYWATSESIVLWFGLAFISIVLIVILVMYVYFSIKDPDRLQSETFVERKMVIEQGKLGDNQVGLNRHLNNTVFDTHYERVDEDNNG